MCGVVVQLPVGSKQQVLGLHAFWSLLIYLCQVGYPMQLQRSHSTATATVLPGIRAAVAAVTVLQLCSKRAVSTAGLALKRNTSATELFNSNQQSLVARCCCRSSCCAEQQRAPVEAPWN